jgi:hypothetical protein
VRDGEITNHKLHENKKTYGEGKNELSVIPALSLAAYINEHYKVGENGAKQESLFSDLHSLRT